MTSDTDRRRRYLSRCPRSSDRYLPPAAFNAIVSRLEAEDPPTADLVQALGRLGLRSVEIRALTWDAVEVSEDTIRLRLPAPRGRSARAVRLPLELRELFARRLAHERGPLVFHRDGRAFDPARAWRRARAAGLQVGLHALRGGFLRYALAAGVSVHTAADLIGISSAWYPVRRSVPPDEDVLSEAIERVNAFITGRAIEGGRP